MVKTSWFVLLPFLLCWQPILGQQSFGTVVVENVDIEWKESTHYEYPKTIPVFPVRVDHYSKQPVSRGRFENLYEHSSPWILLNDTSKKVPLSQFKETLQCARQEPSINGGRGIIDVLKMLPPTREIAQQVCTYIDVGWSWDGVKKSFDKIIASKQCRENGGKAKLFRVWNGQLYSDWPWCVVDDGAYDNQRLPITSLLMHVLDYVSNMKDSAFLVAAEQSIMHYLKPFPVLSNSGEIHKGDIPWPWHTNTKTEFELYTYSKLQNNFNEDIYRSKFVPHYLAWSKRTAKALYVDDLMSINLILFAQAAARPDLIEAHWTCENNCDVEALDPTSEEDIKVILFHSLLKGAESHGNNSSSQRSLTGRNTVIVDKKLVVNRMLVDQKKVYKRAMVDKKLAEKRLVDTRAYKKPMDKKAMDRKVEVEKRLEDNKAYRKAVEKNVVGKKAAVEKQAVVDKRLVGHLSSLTSMHISHAVHPHYGQYKYVVVLSGLFIVMCLDKLINMEYTGMLN